MSSGENFCLCLNEFESNVKIYWQQLQLEKDFCDVTLACDNRNIKTHKVLISSFSPVLIHILKQNPNSHPLIYLRRVKYTDLQNLVNFMYQGEVDVAEEDLSSFLEVADDLQIRGLSERNQEEDHLKQAEPSQNYPSIISPSVANKKTITDNNISEKICIEQIHLNDDFNEPVHAINKSPTLVPTESKSIARTEMNQYSQRLVVSGDKPYSCEKCDKSFSKRGLSYHKESVHDGVRYPCQQCDYKAAKKTSLKKHVASVHQRLVVNCAKCNKQFSGKDNLQIHNLSAHEGIRYPCEFCDYKATQRISLRKHKLTHKND